MSWREPERLSQCSFRKEGFQSFFFPEKGLSSPEKGARAQKLFHLVERQDRDILHTLFDTPDDDPGVPDLEEREKRPK